MSDGRPDWIGDAYDRPNDGWLPDRYSQQHEIRYVTTQQQYRRQSIMTDKALATKADNNLPAHLQAGKKASFGNVDASDLIIPRVKLLQGISPEVEAFDEAKAGMFWHSLADKSLGSKLRFSPLVLKKELVLWAPLGDDRGILARSSDCIHWDENFANLEFSVKIKNVGDVVWNTRGNVAESGLANFGSYVPKDTNSRPAASLTYRMMFYFWDFPELSPGIVINTRASVKAAKQLITKIEMRNFDHYDQIFVMGVTDEKGAEGPYKGYSYTADGYTDEAQHDLILDQYTRFKDAAWKTNDDNDEAASTESGPNKNYDASKDKDIPF